ncbi:MAG: energy transducer TonB [Pyrinomonadaceae bacterium]
MFDKLVVSEPEGADFKSRRRYFVTSSLVVGVLFLAAVVASIFAADFSLGSSSFELAQMLSPVEMATVEPETPQLRTNQSRVETQSDLPSRQVNMANLRENPIVPTGISVNQNTQLARPDTGRFIISKINSDGGAPNGSGRSTDVGGERPTGLAQTGPTIGKVPETDVPPRIEKQKPQPPKSEGVVNGKATYLPKPVYSAAAKAVNAQGKVDVQVTIDEAGNVISARAASGNVLLRSAAEDAARRAKFSVTYLSRVPVKVTGVIVYNFVR